jgi:hypothetical protein
VKARVRDDTVRGGGVSARLQHTPVALFIFKRPEATRQVLARIAQARPPRLLVIADGPRAERPEEAEQCARTRALIESLDWDCEVSTLYSPLNLGCKRRVASGLEWVFAQTETAIILEDDCLPEPEFFPFCETLLARYRDDPRVHMIRGTNLLFGRRYTPDSYYFSDLYNIWGWASWARAWQGYDVSLSAWPQLRASGWLERKLPDPAKAGLVRHFLDETHAGRIDTWDYQWLLNGWLRDALAIVPACNLVRNIGHGRDATHTQDDDNALARLDTGRLDFPLRHPARVEAQHAADEQEWRNVYPGIFAGTNLWQRTCSRLRRLFAATGVGP